MVLEGTVERLNEIMFSQQEKLRDFEDCSRKNTLLIFGIPEPRRETKEETKTEVVAEIFRDNLGVTGNFVERV